MAEGEEARPHRSWDAASDAVVTAIRELAEAARGDHLEVTLTCLTADDERVGRSTWRLHRRRGWVSLMAERVAVGVQGFPDGLIGVVRVVVRGAAGPVARSIAVATRRRTRPTEATREMMHDALRLWRRSQRAQLQMFMESVNVIKACGAVLGPPSGVASPPAASVEAVKDQVQAVGKVISGWLGLPVSSDPPALPDDTDLDLPSEWEDIDLDDFDSE